MTPTISNISAPLVDPKTGILTVDWYKYFLFWDKINRANLATVDGLPAESEILTTAGGWAVTAGITVTGGLDVASGSVTFPAGSIANSALAAPPVFTKSYTSDPQTITSGGTLTLAHGLGAAPKLILCKLRNVAANLGYSVGDEVLFGLPGVSVTNASIAVVPDATNINITFGSASTVFVLLNKGTGVGATATNADWNLIVSAWA